MKSILSFLILISYAQVKAQQFQELIHPGANQEARHIEYAIGGGYLLASNFTDSSGEKSILLTRFDNVLNIVWHKTIDEVGTVERVNSFAQDASGNIFIAGNTEDSFATAFYKSVVIKTDSSGNLIWEKILNYSDYNNLAYYILPISSGSIYVVGEAEDDISNQVAYRQYLIKLNSSGGIQFARDYPESWHSTHSSQILKSSDNQLMVSGWSTTINGDQMGLTKFDTAGNKLWDHRWFGGYAHYNASLNMTYSGTGGYMICGYKNIDSGYYDFRNYFAECDFSGNIINLIHYGISSDCCPNWLYYINSIQTSDGGYAAVGFFDLGYPVAAIALFKVDSDLVPQWCMVYDSGYVTYNTHSRLSLLQTSDGGYLMACSHENDILLIKTDANGISLCNEHTQPIFYFPETQGLSGSLTDYQNTSFNALLYQPVISTVGNVASTDTLCYIFTSSSEIRQTFSFDLHPDPADAIINISFHDNIAGPVSLSIFNMVGERVKHIMFSGHEESIDISRLSEGIYSAILSDGKNFTSGKFLKVRK